MSKKPIIIAAAAGVLSFGSAFVAGWFTKPAAVMGSVEFPQATGTAPRAPADGLAPPQILRPPATSPEENTTTRSMTEEQLKELIYEVREKIQEYNKKLNALETEKERLRLARQTLNKDVETLNNLRVDLAATVASVKNERDLLLKTRVEIEQTEKANLVAIAAAYDKMDAASACQILSNMALGQTKNGGNNRNASIDDAVKILYYMQERTKAKVLAEMVSTEPTLAALLSQKLKQVQEGK